VTTLSLPQGEILMAKAAGDTVRWQIGEAGAGEAATAQTLVLLKPLQRGLETNLVLTTNRRIYLIHLKSGPSDGYNPAVRWAIPEPPATRTPSAAATAEPLASASIRPAAPERPLNLGYRIEPRGRRAPWTPTAVFDDGRRTFIAFPPELQVVEAPALFVIGPDGEPQFANYRQADSLFIVDRVFDQAELRLGDRRPQVVRIRRLAGGGS
jgi:type IV secretion system protein VirB9